MFSKIFTEIRNNKILILSMIVAFGICIGGYFLYNNNHLTILYSLICLIIIISLFSINNITNFIKLSLIFFFLFLLNYLYQKDISIYNLSPISLLIGFIIFSWANNIAFIGIFYYIYKILKKNTQWSIYLFSKKIYFIITTISILTGYIFYTINPLSHLLPYKEITLFTMTLIIIMTYSLPKKICMWFCACSYFSFLLSFLFVILLVVLNGSAYTAAHSLKKYFFNTNFSYLATFQILTFMPLIFMIIPEKIYSKSIKSIGIILIFIFLTSGLLTRYYPIFTNYYNNFSHY